MKIKRLKDEKNIGTMSKRLKEINSFIFNSNSIVRNKLEILTYFIIQLDVIEEKNIRLLKKWTFFNPLRLRDHKILQKKFYYPSIHRSIRDHLLIYRIYYRIHSKYLDRFSIVLNFLNPSSHKRNHPLKRHTND